MRRKYLYIGAVFLVAGVYTGYAGLRPLEPITPSITPVSFTTLKPELSLDYQFSVSLYAEGLGMLTEHRALEPRSTASTIKVLTAALVLQKKPLKPGEQGEMITFDEQDVARYQAMQAEGQSTVAVVAGESVTERQALEALLVASANNIAEKLAVWAFGSQEAYLKTAQRFTEVKGLSRTKVADASGFSADTKSSAADMQVIVQEALQNPVILDIASKTEVTFGSQVLTNTNKLLGIDGIDGLKTGYTDEAGGSLLLTQQKGFYGETLRVSAVILGAPDRAATFTSGRTVLAQAKDFISTVNITTKGNVVGSYSAPWGAKAEIGASDRLDSIAVKGREVFARPEARSMLPASKGTSVGTLSSHGKSVGIELKEDLAPPSLWWRITHPR